MTEIKINSKSSALLVMDFQINMIDRLSLDERAKVLSNTARVVNKARKCNMLIIYVIAQFRKGHPEASPKNTFYSRVKQDKVLMEGNPEVEICSELRPQPGDIVIVKKRLSAFTGSDLEVILRSNNIDTVVLTGVSTLGVVESTARYAFDLDYQIFVLSDCCTDRVAGAHEIALKWVMPKISTVCTSDEFVTAIM